MTKEELKPLIAIVLKQLMARECTALKELKAKEDIDEELESALNDALVLILGYLHNEPEIHVYPSIPLPTIPQTPWPHTPWYTETTTSVGIEPKDCEVTLKNK